MDLRGKIKLNIFRRMSASDMGCVIEINCLFTEVSASRPFSTQPGPSTATYPAVGGVFHRVQR